MTDFEDTGSKALRHSLKVAAGIVLTLAMTVVLWVVVIEISN
jgi:hypothetical protein